MVIKKYNWIYRLNNGDLEVIPNIKDKKPEPEVLNKYYCLSENSVDALINNYIYASHPVQLNDPFDCNYKLLKFNDLDTIKSLLKGVLESNEIIKRWNTDKEDFIRDVQFNYFHKSFIDLGIFSLTSDPLNILMWTYYSHNNGFVIQYDLQELKKNDSPNEIVSGPFQINYQNEILPIEFDIKP